MNGFDSAKVDISNKFYQKLSALHAWADEYWISLPKWAHFYLEIGTLLGSMPRFPQSNRIVMVLAVPTRSFVSSLVAAGIVSFRAIHPSEKASNQKHITSLKNAKIGTSVYLRSEERRLQGILHGYMTDHQGKIYFKVQIDRKNNTIRHISEKDAISIEILEDKKVHLPNSQKGRTRRELAPLVIGLLEEDSSRFSSESCLDCVIFGQLSILKQELEEQRIAIPPSGSKTGNYLEGVLSDIVRPKRFLPASSTYRSHALPSSNKRTVTLGSVMSPHVTIFDGSASYLRLWHDWGKSHCIVILDRTEPVFEEALAQINQVYIARRIDRSPPIRVPPIPAGVELMIFEVS